mmetsp:Transcript_89120/g.199292  ORF Transcript_89120/g.199292 Transcript_89120/m.199292 type:complete len:212 (-) Transcript_89120:302-937(-)
MEEARRSLLGSEGLPLHGLPAPADEEVDLQQVVRLGRRHPCALVLSPLGLRNLRAEYRGRAPLALLGGWEEEALLLLAVLDEAELHLAARRHFHGDGSHARDGPVLHPIGVPLVEGARDAVVVVLAVILLARADDLLPLQRLVWLIRAVELDDVLVSGPQVLVWSVPLPLGRIGSGHPHLRRRHLLQPSHERGGHVWDAEEALTPEDAVAV